MAQGYDTLVKHAVEGIRGMPAKGGATDLTNEEVARAVAYMGNAAGAKFTEPAVAGAEGGGAAAAIDPNVKGKEIYASVCMAAMIPAQQVHLSLVTKQLGHHAYPRVWMHWWLLVSKV